MELTATIGNARFSVDLNRPHDLSIPVLFEGQELNVFGAPKAYRAPHAAGRFVGRVEHGGSCNCDTLHFTPHTSGTHTESIGHLTAEPFPIPHMLRDSFIPATLITIDPVQASDSTDHYQPALEASNRLITRGLLENALKDSNPDFHKALVLRTLPNGPQKRTADYDHAEPPFFSIEAMEYLVALNIQHLLVDLPSLDRLHDEGMLTTHRIFWNLPKGSKPSASHKTVSELLYIAPEIPDGYYLLNLQLAPLHVDAAPSRPLLYGITRL